MFGPSSRPTLGRMSPQRTLHLAAQTVGLAGAFSRETDPVRRKYDLAAISEAAQLLEGVRAGADGPGAVNEGVERRAAA